MIPISPRHLAGAALLACVAVAGCGGPAAAPPDAAPSAAAPTAVDVPSAAPTLRDEPAAGGSPVDASALPWPGGGDSLQRAVDDGAQPWLLDPAEVATSFATSVLGWSGVAAATRDEASTVALSSTDGRRAVVTVTQPGRVGPGGIWVVTAVSEP